MRPQPGVLSIRIQVMLCNMHTCIKLEWLTVKATPLMCRKLQPHQLLCYCCCTPASPSKGLLNMIVRSAALLLSVLITMQACNAHHASSAPPCKAARREDCWPLNRRDAGGPGPAGTEPHGALPWSGSGGLHAGPGCAGARRAADAGAHHGASLPLLSGHVAGSRLQRRTMWHRTARLLHCHACLAMLSHPGCRTCVAICVLHLGCALRVADHVAAQQCEAADAGRAHACKVVAQACKGRVSCVLGDVLPRGTRDARKALMLIWTIADTSMRLAPTHPMGEFYDSCKKSVCKASTTMCLTLMRALAGERLSRGFVGQPGVMVARQPPRGLCHPQPRRDPVLRPRPSLQSSFLATTCEVASS